MLQHRIKAHARIIWGVSWSWDSSFFATASRDGTVKVWSQEALSSTSKPVTKITLGQPVTALAFAPKDDASDQYKLALGSETGAVSVWSISLTPDEASSSCTWQSPLASSHCSPVRRMCWQSKPEQGVTDMQSDQVQTRLAICADDHCIRIFRFNESG